MLDALEIEVKMDFETWKTVDTLYPNYKMGSKKPFYPWSEPRAVYINIDEAEIEVIQVARRKAYYYLKAWKGCKIVRIWQYVDGKKVWLMEYYPEDVN